MKDHTGENIAEAMTEVLENLNLKPTNLDATTTDNGSNVLCAFWILDWCQISCFVHAGALGVSIYNIVCNKCNNICPLASSLEKAQEDQLQK